MNAPNPAFTTNTVQSLPGEVAPPNLNEAKSSALKRAAGMLALFALLCGGGALAYYKYVKHKRAEAQIATAVDQQIKPPSIGHKAFASEPAKDLPLETLADPGEPPIPLQPKGTGGNQVPPVQPAAAAAVADPMKDRYESELMPESLGRPSEVVSRPAMAPASGSEPGFALGNSGGLSGLLTSTSTATRNATRLPNRNFLLTKGTFIDCGMKTALNSTVAGMTSCTVTNNIYSDNGKVLLIERGSKVTGEYQGNMKQGQARIFVLWTRIETPTGVVVNLDSPGTDGLGGSGLPGYVDTHFWERFGNAIMLSIIQDGLAAMAQPKTDAGSGTTIYTGTQNTRNNSQSLAEETLRNSINIPPTIYKNQGDRIGIFVARDLNFSSVYALEETHRE